MTLLDQVLADLAAECSSLDEELRDLAEDQWRCPTPAPGWDVATQVAHLAWTDDVAIAAADAARGWKQTWDDFVQQAIADPHGFVDAEAFRVAQQRSRDLLTQWRAGRASLAEALRTVPEGMKMPWFGPPMSPVSMASARFMETWAHGADVRDALGVPIIATDRIRHVAHIGVRTRDFAFGLHDLSLPRANFHVVLTAPSGAQWTWGEPDADQSVSGPALDFCLLVTQRRHRDDLALVATGEDANRWLDIAQAFAGPPGEGRTPAGTSTGRVEG